MPRKATTYLLQAGQQSANRSAMAEARAHLTRGLALAAKLPDTIDKNLGQTELLLVLGNVDMAQHDFGSSGHAKTLADAAPLCSGLDAADAEQRRLMSRSLWGEWTRKVHVELSRHQATGTIFGVDGEVMCYTCLHVHSPASVLWRDTSSVAICFGICMHDLLDIARYPPAGGLCGRTHGACLRAGVQLLACAGKGV